MKLYGWISQGLPRLFRPTIMLPLIILASGCQSGGAPSGAGAVKAPPAPSDPTEFLKWSMAKHADLKSYRAGCDWETDFMVNAGPSARASRLIQFQAPNRILVSSAFKEARTTIKVVSDGVRIAEQFGDAPPQIKKSIPKSFSKAEALLLQHPMFCGSLLYKFFDGPTAIAQLVKSSTGPVKFGPDVTLEGEPCRTLQFTAVEMFGRAEIAIRTSDGMVRRIRYDSGPALRKMRYDQTDGLPESSNTTEYYHSVEANPKFNSSDFDVDKLALNSKRAPSPIERDILPPKGIKSLAP